MARKPRIEYPGALYHVMCRANNGEFVLRDDEEKKLYIFLLDKYKERYGFKLYAYCLMDNHVHLLIETGNEPLSKIMQGIQQSFTQIFNKKYRRSGHVFQQRYKSLLCDKDNYLLSLIKYIHYNPIEAYMKEGLNYKWSSHSSYVNPKKDSLVEIDFVLAVMGGDIKRGIKEYIKYMNLKEEEVNIEDFLLDELEVHYKLQEIERRENIVYDDGNIDVEAIIDVVCSTAEVSQDDIVRRTRIRKYADIRKVIVLVCERYSRVTNKELAKRLNISPSMVSKIISGDIILSNYAEKLKDEIMSVFDIN